MGHGINMSSYRLALIQLLMTIGENNSLNYAALQIEW